MKNQFHPTRAGFKTNSAVFFVGWASLFILVLNIGRNGWQKNTLYVFCKDCTVKHHFDCFKYFSNVQRNWHFVKFLTLSTSTCQWFLRELVACNVQLLNKKEVYHKLDQVNSASLLFELRSFVFYVSICYRICRAEQLSWGTLLQGILSRGTLIYDGTGSKKGGTGWYLVVLGQYEAVLVGTWWYLVIITWFCVVLSGTGSIKGCYACIYWKN